jgi:hypothetical protein
MAAPARGAAARLCCASCVAVVEGLPSRGRARFAAEIWLVQLPPFRLARSSTAPEQRTRVALLAPRLCRALPLCGSPQVCRSCRPAHGGRSLFVLRSACETASVVSVTWRSAGLPAARCLLSAVCLPGCALSAVYSSLSATCLLAWLTAHRAAPPTGQPHAKDATRIGDRGLARFGTGRLLRPISACWSCHRVHAVGMPTAPFS